MNPVKEKITNKYNNQISNDVSVNICSMVSRHVGVYIYIHQLLFLPACHRGIEIRTLDCWAYTFFSTEYALNILMYL